MTKYIRITEAGDRKIAQLVQKASQISEYEWRPSDGTIAGLLLDDVLTEPITKLLGRIHVRRK